MDDITLIVDKVDATFLVKIIADYQHRLNLNKSNTKDPTLIFHYRAESEECQMLHEKIITQIKSQVKI